MAKSKSTPEKQQKPIDKVKSFETFREVGSYTMSGLIQKEPSSFNGNVQIRKYKITIELIEEPHNVLCERLQKLWDECDNWHHWTPLKNVAKELGYELTGDAGSLRKKY